MASETPKVTVLVPCYNVEKFLPQCLESLIGQSLRQLQIICINDGSTDSTLAVLRSYAARDKRIQIIDKPNSGYGASMNRGLDAARGEYVGIVESDDFAERDMFKKLYRFARFHRCDLVKSNYSEYCAGQAHPIEAFAGFKYKRVFKPADQVDVVKVLPIIWTGLYRTSMLRENGIRFNETPGASYQDTSFVQRAWFAAERAALLPDCLLNYRVDNAASSVKSQAKVYAVCDEFAASEAYLAARPAKQAAFAPVLAAVKFATYKWNYNRIAPEYRSEFALRWAAEMEDADRRGFLDPALLSDADRALCPELLADPEAFCAAHPEDLPW